MKTITVITLMLFSATVLAQTKNAPINLSSAEPVFMIDSVKVNKAYFNYTKAEDIATFTVNRTAQYPGGLINTIYKDHNKALKLLQSPLLSLSDIAKANVLPAERSKPILFIMDDILLTDTAGVRIPAMFVYHVAVLKAAETAYFKKALPNVLLMMIATKPPVTFIRGLTANTSSY